MAAEASALASAANASFCAPATARCALKVAIDCDDVRVETSRGKASVDVRRGPDLEYTVRTMLVGVGIRR